MSLDEFKVIFYWEYAHRLLARFVGLFTLVPLLFFTVICILKIPKNIQINIIGYFFLCAFKDLLVGIWSLVD